MPLSCLTLPVVETEARQERSGCHNRFNAPSLGPAAHHIAELLADIACCHNMMNFQTHCRRFSEVGMTHYAACRV